MPYLLNPHNNSLLGSTTHSRPLRSENLASVNEDGHDINDTSVDLLDGQHPAHADEHPQAGLQRITGTRPELDNALARPLLLVTSSTLVISYHARSL